MAFELEGNLSIERAHTRRWVSIIAVVIPVAAFVLLAAWFIRAYIVPPTVAIHSPPMMADAPPPPPAVPKRARWSRRRSRHCRWRSAAPAGPSGQRDAALLHSRCRCLRRSRRRHRRCPARHRLSPIQRRTSRGPSADRGTDHSVGREPAESPALPIEPGRADRRTRSAAAGQAARTRSPLSRSCGAAAAAEPAESLPSRTLPAVDRHGVDCLRRAIPSRRRSRSAPAQILPP